MGEALLIILMIGTLAALGYGVVGMVTKNDPKKQNKAMQMRVALQGGALLLLMILFAVGKDG